MRSSEASLTTLPGLAISIRHKELGVLVAPPLALSGDRADLLGDDALLVGQTYVCEVSLTSTLTITLTLTLTPTLTLTLTLTLTRTLTLARRCASARRAGRSAGRRARARSPRA